MRWRRTRPKTKSAAPPTSSVRRAPRSAPNSVSSSPGSSFSPGITWPPFRPDAPEPTRPASSTTTDAPPSARCRAADRPTVASRWPSTASWGGSRPWVRSAGGGGDLGHPLHHHRRVHRGRVDLQDFEVVGALELVVDDAGGLEHAVAGAEGALALALVHELDRALEHIEHLEIALVLVEAGGVQIVGVAALLHTDDVGAHLAVGGVGDAEVAVLHEAAEALLIDGVLGQARAELLLGLVHVNLLFAIRRCAAGNSWSTASSAPRSTAGSPRCPGGGSRGWRRRRSATPRAYRC